MNMGGLRYIFSFMKIIAIITSLCAGDIVFDQIVPDTQKIHQN